MCLEVISSYYIVTLLRVRRIPCPPEHASSLASAHCCCAPRFHSTWTMPLPMPSLITHVGIRVCAVRSFWNTCALLCDCANILIER